MDLSGLKARDIMIEELITANTEDIVATAKLKMVRKGIGGLPVLDDKRLVGIITHRDIVLTGENVMGLRVGDIMTKEVKTVDTGTALKDVVKLMGKTGYQRIPVVERETLVGMITQSCIINALAERL
jgi:CBS domain-containing protein